MAEVISNPRITVIGSVNMDLLVKCKNIPKPGQTLFADDFVQMHGGKGANQAVAASLAGGSVSFVGRVGSDEYGSRLRHNLEQYQIDTTYLYDTPNTASGVAIITVDESGENSILVVPGANQNLSVEDIDQAAYIIKTSNVVLIQLEIPIQSVLAAIKIAKSAGVRVIFDPAPVPREIPDQMFEVTMICPNETEAQGITGVDTDSIPQLEQAARALHDRGAEKVAITLGKKGTLLFSEGQLELVPAYPVKSVDTTAAGDAFAGGLAVAIGSGLSVVQAVRYANAAGALATTQFGAQTGMAQKDDILRLMNFRL